MIASDFSLKIFKSLHILLPQKVEVSEKSWLIDYVALVVFRDGEMGIVFKRYFKGILDLLLVFLGIVLNSSFFIFYFFAFVVSVSSW